MRAELLDLALYKVWTLRGWKFDIDGLLGKKDCSSHQFEVWTLTMTYRHATRRDPGEVAMTYVGSLSGLPKMNNMAKIKMHTVLALELGCERLVYTGFVGLCTNTSITHETHLTESLPRTQPASATPDKTSTITVCRPSLLFNTGGDC